MDAGYNCAACRELLSDIATEGVVLVDLHDLTNIKAFPVADGADYSIHGYYVAVTEADQQFTIQVRG